MKIFVLLKGLFFFLRLNLFVCQATINKTLIAWASVLLLDKSEAEAFCFSIKFHIKSVVCP